MFLRGLNEHFKTVGHVKIAKHSYESKDDAEFAILELKDVLASSYKCSICGKWHIGHDKFKNLKQL